MQVPPHMREAGGSCPLSSHFFLPRPSWAADVGSRCGQQMWAADVGHRCGTQAWDAGMGRSPLIVGKLGCLDNVPFDGDSLRNACAV